MASLLTIVVHRVDPVALEPARQGGTAEARAAVAAHLAELRDAGADLTVEVSVVDGAWDAFVAGDAEAYDSLIARAVRPLAARSAVEAVNAALTANGASKLRERLPFTDAD